MKTTKVLRGGRVWLRVEADDGRFLLNVCASDAHADRCAPVLQRMLERERLEERFEASGWRRRLPLADLMPRGDDVLPQSHDQSDASC